MAARREKARYMMEVMESFVVLLFVCVGGIWKGQTGEVKHVGVMAASKLEIIRRFGHGQNTGDGRRQRNRIRPSQRQGVKDVIDGVGRAWRVHVCTS